MSLEIMMLALLLSRRRGHRRPAPEPDPESFRVGTLSVACPRCKAEPGVMCDRRTLGRFFDHAARVEEYQRAKAQTTMKE